MVKLISEKIHVHPNAELQNLAYRLDNLDNFINRKIPFFDWKTDESLPLDTRFKVFLSLDKTHDIADPYSFQKSFTGSDDLEYVASGNYGHVFRLFRNRESQYGSLVLKLICYEAFDLPEKIVPAQEYRCLDITDPRRAENVDVEMACLLRDKIVLTGISPHISLPIFAFQCEWEHPSVRWLVGQINDSHVLLKSEEQFNKEYHPNKISFTKSKYKQEYIRDLKRWCSFQQNKKTKKKLPTLTEAVDMAYQMNVLTNPDQKCLIYISEYCRHNDVMHWIKTPRSELEWSVLLFQLFYTIASIHRVIPTWRHNDFSPRNILVQKTNVPEDQQEWKYLYQFGNSYYLIPDVGFSLRLWDFDFANCNELPNGKVHSQMSKSMVVKNKNQSVDWFSDFGITQEQCEQYDLHLFFNYLATYLTKDWYKIPDRCRNVMRSWIPIELRGVDGMDTLHTARLDIETQSNLNQYYTRINDYTRETRYDKLTAKLQLEMEPLFQSFRIDPEEIQSEPGLLGYFHSPQ
jgi:serine/threonine protein kinase